MNGGANAGKAEANDTLSVTWNQAASLTSICSSWTDGTQSVTGITVTMNQGNGSNNNDLTFSGGAFSGTNCTGGVHIGTFTANTGNYNPTNGADTFANFTLSWNTATNTFTITLGSCGASCPSGTVTASIYGYAPAPNITTSASSAITATNPTSVNTGSVKNF